MIDIDIATVIVTSFLDPNDIIELSYLNTTFRNSVNKYYILLIKKIIILCFTINFLISTNFY